MNPGESDGFLLGRFLPILIPPTPGQQLNPTPEVELGTHGEEVTL